MIKEITDKNREQVLAILKQEWYGTDSIIARSRVHLLKNMEGFFYLENGKILGIVTYEIIENDCEVVTLNSLEEGRGIGRKLMRKVFQMAKKEGCRRAWLITTNDNIRALAFYQKIGMDLCAFYHNAMNESRKIKPRIPMVGQHGIPLMHEMEFEMQLKAKN